MLLPTGLEAEGRLRAEQVGTGLAGLWAELGWAGIYQPLGDYFIMIMRIVLL